MKPQHSSPSHFTKAKSPPRLSLPHSVFGGPNLPSAPVRLSQVRKDAPEAPVATARRAVTPSAAAAFHSSPRLATPPRAGTATAAAAAVVAPAWPSTGRAERLKDQSPAALSSLKFRSIEAQLKAAGPGPGAAAQGNPNAATAQRQQHQQQAALHAPGSAVKGTRAAHRPQRPSERPPSVLHPPDFKYGPPPPTVRRGSPPPSPPAKTAAATASSGQHKEGEKGLHQAAAEGKGKELLSTAGPEGAPATEEGRRRHSSQERAGIQQQQSHGLSVQGIVSQALTTSPPRSPPSSPPPSPPSTQSASDTESTTTRNRLPPRDKQQASPPSASDAADTSVLNTSSSTVEQLEAENDRLRETLERLLQEREARSQLSSSTKGVATGGELTTRRSTSAGSRSSPSSRRRLPSTDSRRAPAARRRASGVLRPRRNRTPPNLIRQHQSPSSSRSDTAAFSASFASSSSAELSDSSGIEDRGSGGAEALSPSRKSAAAESKERNSSGSSHNPSQTFDTPTEVESVGVEAEGRTKETAVAVQIPDTRARKYHAGLQYIASQYDSLAASLHLPDYDAMVETEEGAAEAVDDLEEIRCVKMRWHAVINSLMSSQEEAQRAKQQVSDLKQQVRGMEGQVQGLEAMRATIQRLEECVEERGLEVCVNAERDKTAAERQRAAAEAEAEAAKKQAEELQRECNALGEELARARSEAADWTQQAHNSQRAAKQSAAEREALRQQLRELQDRLRQEEASHTEALEALEVAEAQRKGVMEERNSYQRRCVRVEEELNVKAKELDEVRQRLDNLRDSTETRSMASSNKEHRMMRRLKGLVRSLELLLSSAGMDAEDSKAKEEEISQSSSVNSLISRLEVYVERVSNHVAHLENEVFEAQHDKKLADDELRKMQSRQDTQHDRMKAEMEELSTAVTALETALHEKDVDCKALEKDKDRAAADLSTAAEEIAGLKEELQELQASSAEYKEEVASLKRQCKATQQRGSEAQRELERLLEEAKEAQDRYRALQEQLREKDAELSELRAAASQAAFSEDDNRRRSKQLEALEEEVASLHGQLNEAMSKASKAAQQERQAETALTSAQEQLQDVEQRFARSSNALEEQTKELETVREQLTAVVKEKEALAVQLQQAQQEAKQACDANAALEAAEVEARREAIIAREAAAQAKVQLSVCQRKVELLQADLEKAVTQRKESGTATAAAPSTVSSRPVLVEKGINTGTELAKAPVQKIVEYPATTAAKGQQSRTGLPPPPAATANEQFWETVSAWYWAIRRGDSGFSVPTAAPSRSSELMMGAVSPAQARPTSQRPSVARESQEVQGANHAEGNDLMYVIGLLIERCRALEEDSHRDCAQAGTSSADAQPNNTKQLQQLLATEQAVAMQLSANLHEVR